jgi:diguanylate cyclase (GGDEF)-like protein
MPSGEARVSFWDTTALWFDLLSEHLLYISGLSALILVAYFLVLLGSRYEQRPLFHRLAGRTVRGSLALGLGIMTVVPLTFVSGILADRIADSRRAEISQGLQTTATGISHTLDIYLRGLLTDIANIADQLPPEQQVKAGPALDTWLTARHAINNEFDSMVVAGRDGLVVAAAPSAHSDGSRLADQHFNIADRAYFQDTLALGKPHISEVFRGRVYGHDQIIAVSAPLLDRAGGARGVVEGSINLAVFDALERAFPLIDGADLVVVDHRNHVIFSSAPAIWPALTDLSSDAMARAARAAGNSHAFRYRVAPGMPEYYLATSSETANHWRVFMRMPLDRVNERVYEALGVVGLWLLAAIVFALLLAVTLARRITGPLDALSALVEGFEPLKGGIHMAWPENSPQEVTGIYRAFRLTAERVTLFYGKLRESLEDSERLRQQLDEVVANRERVIEDRTAQLARANRLLDQQAKLDPLTGIANRRGAEEFLNRCWSLGMRDQAPLSVLMVDVDFFKAYNDEYGHRAGDECLQKIAAVLTQGAARPLDMAARWGGEEFLVILGATSSDGALTIAERMRKAVEDLGIPHSLAAGGRVVTTSIGVATRVPSRDTHVSSLLEEADQALYRAKQQGRNRVVSA